MRRRPSGGNPVRCLVALVIRAYPPDLRGAFGRDIADTVDDLMADRHSPWRRAWSLAICLWQILAAGLGERMERAASTRRQSAGLALKNQRQRSTPMDRWTQELRFAARSLQGRPAFTVLAVLTLAVGLGTSIAMFGVVRGVLLRPLPHPESERIVSFHRSFTDAPGVEARSMSLPDLRDVQAELSSFEAVAGCNEDQLSSSASGRPELLQAGLVTDGVLAVFGLDPFLGRDLTAKDAEPGTAPVAVLAHHYWRSHLGERPDVLGQALEIGGRAHTVVGVAPPGFSFPNQAQVWVPRQINPEGCGRGCHLIHTVGRLAPGVSLESAEQELAVLGSQLEKTYPRSNTHKRFGVRGLQDQMVGNVKPALWMLLAAVQLVVLIAAANVTHLVLARGTGRARELAVRSALGASRGRLFGQLLMENGLLVAAGLGAALVLARGLLGLLPMVAPGNLPRLGEVGIDGTVV
ncbi:MAG: ABC transporter permease, partial [Acidobacteriota bacterium]